MPVVYEEFEALKSFVEFTEEDAANLESLADAVKKHGPALTDHFYETLESLPATAKLIEGRVESLKETHRQYLVELTSGAYGAAYFERRRRIGQVHVERGIDPRFVEGVMSVIRAGMLKALSDEISDPVELSAKASSFIKLCDLDLAIINLAYSEERLDRFSEFTGMKRKLIENVMTMAKR